MAAVRRPTMQGKLKAFSDRNPSSPDPWLVGGELEHQGGDDGEVDPFSLVSAEEVPAHPSWLPDASRLSSAPSAGGDWHDAEDEELDRLLGGAFASTSISASPGHPLLITPVTASGLRLPQAVMRPVPRGPMLLMGESPIRHAKGKPLEP